MKKYFLKNPNTLKNKTQLDEKTSKLFLKLDFEIIKAWITNDARKGREHENI
jgi:hypothetical protein